MSQTYMEFLEEKFQDWSHDIIRRKPPLLDDILAVIDPGQDNGRVRDWAIGQKICTTWHTYTMNKNAMLKKTRWYLMDSIDDAKMKPAIEEDIEEIRWMTRKEVYHALEHSYKSISHVFEEYYKKIELKPAP